MASTDAITTQPAKKRYDILDLFRGLAQINMIAFHAMYDIVYIFGHQYTWYYGKGAYIWQQYICWSFIFISGFCWSFGKKKWKRGMIVFGMGALVSLATFLFMPDEIVIFGVLTLIGTCVLLTIPIDHMIEKITKGKEKTNRSISIIGLIIVVALFVLTKNITQMELGFESIRFCKLPENLYHMGYGMTFLGFCDTSFYSSDYFPLMPWLFLFLIGYFLRRIMGNKITVLTKFNSDSKWLLPLKFFGKYSLWIYMAHQPVVYGILLLIHSI